MPRTHILTANALYSHTFIGLQYHNAQRTSDNCVHELPTDMVGSCPIRNLVPPYGLSVTLNVSLWQVFGLCGGQSASPDTTGQSISHARAVMDCGCAPVSQT